MRATDIDAYGAVNQTDPFMPETLKLSRAASSLSKRDAGRSAATTNGPEDIDTQKTGSIVKPVSNAFRILRYLSALRKPARATQIARELSINTSTCFNILRTMVGEGVVEFNAQSKAYSLGLGIVKLVDTTLIEGQRMSAARSLMHDIAERFRVTTTLWRRIGPDRIVLAMVENSPSDFRIHMAEGQRLPMFIGAAGRLVAANSGLTKADIRSAFNSLRWDRALSFSAYWQQVREAGECGWAVDDGYYSQGIVAIAAPIFDAQNQLMFAISAVMFRGQYDEAGIARVGEELKGYATRLAGIML